MSGPTEEDARDAVIDRIAQLSRRMREIAEDPNIPNERVEWATTIMIPQLQRLVESLEREDPPA